MKDENKTKARLLEELSSLRGLEQRLKNRTRALRESEEQFKAFMDNIPGAVYIKDDKDRHVFCNRLAVEAVGKKAEEIVGSRTRDLFPPQIADRLVELDRKVLNANIPRLTDEYHHTTKGGARWLRDIKFPISLESGKKLLGGIAIDITTIKQSQENLKELATELKESEERYRALVEAAPVLIMAIRNGCILFSNPAAARMLGFSNPDKMVGIRAIDIVAPESQLNVQGSAFGDNHGLLDQIPQLPDITPPGKPL